jgi:hypothetical protein
MPDNAEGKWCLRPVFLRSLESVLQHRRIVFSRAEAIVFVESCWELIVDEPDVWFWAERFVEMNNAASGKVLSKSLGTARGTQP